MSSHDNPAKGANALEQIAKLQQDLDHTKAAAKKAAQVKVEFLAKMSHEIRTPLNGLYGMIHLLEHTKTDDTQKKYLHLARKSAEDLRILVDDILNFSKTITDTLKLEKKSFSLKETIATLLSGLQDELEEKEHTLLTTIDDKIPEHLVGDPLRLTQVISNLLTNAIKYTDKKGEIHLEIDALLITEQESKIQISVIDNGRGMSEEELEAIFDPFVQIHPSQNTVNPGTGLGLAITRKLIELMNGKIWVESEQEKGSTFFFTLTLQNCEQKEEPKQRRQKYRLSHKMSQRLKPILLVEDNKINRELARIALLDAGYKVEIAVDGQEALDAYKEKAYELILMDINMPKVDGVTATLEIRAREKTEQSKRVPIVALTAYAKSEDEEHFLNAGMDYYLSKPVNLNQLFETIQKITGKE